VRVQVKMQHHTVHSNEVVRKLREEPNVQITRLQVGLFPQLPHHLVAVYRVVLHLDLHTHTRMMRTNPDPNPKPLFSNPNPNSKP
jgi:hypothetical protein